MDISKLKNIYNKIKLVNINDLVINVLKNADIIEVNKKKVSLSVVVSSHNRKEQTYFSLKSWNNIAILNNIYIQVIIVEDTVNINDKINPDELFYSDLNITYIYIKNKIWDNPCLNYNIGFKYIKSDCVIITNAETCVFGNIYDIVKNKLTSDNYLVFDVFNIGNKWHTNDNLNIWNSCHDFKYETINDFKKNKEIHWLQSKNNNRQLHFLTCINYNSLKKIFGFDEEFLFGQAHDDDMLLFQIKNYLKLNIVNIHHDEFKIVGLHQWHQTETSTSSNYINGNHMLYNFKTNYTLKTGKYLYLKDFKTFDDLLENINI